MDFIFSTSQLLVFLFHILCLLVVQWFLFVLCLLGAFSFDIIFSLVFHYSTQSHKQAVGLLLVFQPMSQENGDHNNLVIELIIPISEEGLIMIIRN